MSKRTLDSFFQTPSKKLKTSPIEQQQTSPASVSSTNGTTTTVVEEQKPSAPPTNHPTYPFALPQLPPDIANTLQYSPATPARHINDRPNLDLLYYEPFIDRKTAQQLFKFLRKELFFYRVKYKIRRGPVETDINTPRFTTVFGVDESSRWTEASPESSPTLVETASRTPVDSKKYSRQPRPIPGCLETLRLATEAVTGETFNFCLVNYYADGNDSISYHSDDERFLGPDPAIASFTLGAKRDFLMKPKPVPPAAGNAVQRDKNDEKPLKLPLSGGDMVLMRGRTQGKWLHSIPKRKGGQGDGGRINITFRKAMVKAGTENYYQYNVGQGPVYVWDESKGEMVIKDGK